MRRARRLSRSGLPRRGRPRSAPSRAVVALDASPSAALGAALGVPGPRAARLAAAASPRPRRAAGAAVATEAVRVPALAAALAAALLLAPAARACPGLDAPCTIAGPFGAGEYRLALPDGPGPFPAILALHGHGGFAAALAASPTIAGEWLARGWAVIAPQGMPRSAGAPGGSWNSRGAPQGRDDVAFLRAVAADAVTRAPLDPERIVAAGFSAGGMMTWRLACAAPSDAPPAEPSAAPRVAPPVAAARAAEAPDRAAAAGAPAGGFRSFAAYIPVAGLLWRPLPATCAGPAPMLHIHGWTDPVVPIEGRALRGASGGGDALLQGDLFQGLALMRRTNRCPADAPAASAASGPFWTRGWACEGAPLAFALHAGGHLVPPGWAALALDWLAAEKLAGTGEQETAR